LADRFAGNHKQGKDLIALLSGGPQLDEEPGLGHPEPDLLSVPLAFADGAGIASFHGNQQRQPSKSLAV